MGLDYEALRKIAERKAVRVASCLYPPGDKRKGSERKLADKYYAEFTTPPFGQRPKSPRQ